MSRIGFTLKMILGFCLVLNLVGCSTWKYRLKSNPNHRQGLLDSHSLDEASNSNSLIQPVHNRFTQQQKLARLKWPLRKVEVTSPFGFRKGRAHEGVDLRAPTGTAVFAAQGGVVLYAGSRIRGYGKMVVIRHNNQIATVYAHNSRLLVKRGQTVKQGQKIAISGSTGRSRGPHLHFEIRHGLAAVNPLEWLPHPVQKAETISSSPPSRLTASQSKLLSPRSPL